MRRVRCKWLFGAACLAAVALCGGAIGEEAGPVAATDVASIQPLISRWWQWRVALPDLATPSKDPTGRLCDVGQPADVWFLAGFLSTGSESARIRRHCAVEGGRSLFVPVVTMVNYPRDASLPLTCERVASNARAAVDAARDVAAEVDGRALPPSDLVRVASETCFPLFRAIATKETGLPASADGYWLLLRPLPKGPHTLRMTARYAPESLQGAEFQDTTYDLDVR